MRLREFRKEKKLTQKEIAEVLNVAPTTYTGYELETSEPSIETLIKLAEFYKTSLDHLVGRETKQINMLALPDEKREIFEVVLTLNEPETKKIHAFVAGFASAKNEWPPQATKKPPDLKPGYTKFNNY